jgi:transposase
MPKRKRLSAIQKAQIVLEAIQEDKSVAQIATENSIHPNQIHKWKRQALEDFAQLFEDDRKGERAREVEHDGGSLSLGMLSTFQAGCEDLGA